MRKTNWFRCSARPRQTVALVRLRLEVDVLRASAYLSISDLDMDAIWQFCIPGHKNVQLVQTNEVLMPPGLSCIQRGSAGLPVIASKNQLLT